MKKNLFSIFCLVLIMLAGFYGMSTVIGISSNQGWTPTSGVGGHTTPNFAPHVYYGARVSLVDNTGTLVSDKVVDFWPKSLLNDNVIKNYGMTIDGVTYYPPNTIDKSTYIFYGTNIRQNVTTGDGTTVFEGGEYFSLHNVVAMESLFSGYANVSSYSRGEATVVAKFSEDFRTHATVNQNLANRMLQYLGYTGTIQDAANSDYYIQYEPLILAARHNNGNLFFLIGTATELMSSFDSAWAWWWFNTSHSRSPLIYIKPGYERPSVFHIDGNSIPSTTSLEEMRNIHVGVSVSHQWTGDFIGGMNCSTAAAYLNNGRIGEFQQVKNGNKFTINGVDYVLNDTERNKLKKDSTNKAYCEEVTICGSANPLVSLGSCSNDIGLTYYKDSSNKQQWLVCEVAYSDGGKIYGSENTGHLGPDTASGEKTYVGNSSYCQVFCYEEVSTDFPTKTSPTLVKAGQTFGWGIHGGRDGIFGTVSVKKECSVQEHATTASGEKGYKYDTWKRDYIANEEKLIKAYLNALAYKDLQNRETEVSSSQDSCSGEGVTYNSTTKKCEVTTENVLKDVCEGTWTSSIPGRENVPGTCVISSEPLWKATASKKGGAITKVYNADGFVGKVTSDAINATGTASGKTTKEDAEKEASDNLDRAISAGIQSNDGGFKASESSLLTAISQCVNNLEYQYGTVVNLLFDEPVNSHYNTNKKLPDSSYALDATVISGSLISTNTATSCPTENIPKYSINGNTVQQEAQKVKTYNCQDTGITWKLEATIQHTYPAPEFTWFTLKTDGTLLNDAKKEDRNSTDSYGSLLTQLDSSYFYYIGYGLPTALTLTAGDYSRLKVEVSKLGDQDPMAMHYKDYNGLTITEGHFEPLLLETMSNGSKGFPYVCSYEVNNDIFGYDCPGSSYCDSVRDDSSDGDLKGIDVAYRVISLLSDGDEIKKAFPGQSGSGRIIGSNWNKLTNDEIYDILDTDVYDDSSAMYDIMLDVNTIQEIRRDTQNFTNGNPYTTYSNVICKSKSNDPNSSDYNQTYCASDFITDLRGKIVGTCMPTGLNTGERADYILTNGCNVAYNPIVVDWTR